MAVTTPDRGPPDVKPGELLARLTQLPRPFQIVPFPRRDPMTKEQYPDIAIWPLTQRELMDARAAAQVYAQKMFPERQRAGDENLGYKAIYDDACTVELLVRACRDPKDLKSPAFPTAKIAREHITANEFAVLVRLYLQIEREVGPLVDLMSLEEMDAWLKRLAEDGSRVPLALLSSEQLEDLLMHSASRLSRSSTGTGSSGAPRSDGSSDDDEAPPAVEADAPPMIDEPEPMADPDPEG